MKRIVVINKDFERFYEDGVMIYERELERVHKGAPNDFAVNEIWIGGMAQWTTRDGLAPVNRSFWEPEATDAPYGCSEGFDGTDGY